MSLINKQNCKKFLLDYAGRSRHHKFTRVGKDALEKAEVGLRDVLRDIVHAQPSKGKTIK